MGRDRSMEANFYWGWRALVMGVAVGVVSGTAFAGGSGGPSAVAVFYLTPRLSLAEGDAQAGVQGGFEMPAGSFRAGLYGDFEARVFGKDRLIPVSPTLRVQVQEERQSLGLGGYAALPVQAGVAVRLGGGAGYTLGQYRGVEWQPEPRWIPWVDGGLLLGGAGSLRGELTYQYRPWPNASPHRVALSLGMRFAAGGRP